MSGKRPIESASARKLAARIATRWGLVPGESTRVRYAPNGVFVTYHPMTGTLDGVQVSFQLQFYDGSPSELGAAIDIRVGLHWLDLSMIGRGYPEAFPSRERALSAQLLGEFSIECGDETYLGELVGGELEQLLIAANLAGYRPRLGPGHLQMSAGALGAAGAEKLLRDAVQLGAVIEQRRRELGGASQERAILAALSAAEKTWDARLDRELLRLDHASVVGRLSLETEHPSYGEWRTAIQLDLETALPFALSIAPVRRFYETWFRPDIRTGDSEFDHRFTIRGEPEERVLAVLGERSRRALERVVELTGDVLVTQTTITSVMPHALAEAERACAIVEAVHGLGDALTSHVGGQRAYR